MSEPEGSRGRTARGRAQAWLPWATPWAPSSARPTWAWPEGLANLARPAARQIREWAIIETGVGRLVPWLAIGFGCGILLYFNIDQEPAPWAVAILFIATAAGAASLRLRPVGFPLALFAAAMALGFATATIKRAVIAHPVLWLPAWNVDVAGFVESREERERSDRITVRVEHIAGPRLQETSRTHSGSGPQGYGAGGRSIRGVQDSVVSTARTSAPRWIRFCAGHVLPAHWRLGLRPRPHTNHRRAARAEHWVALRNDPRWHARGD